MCWDFIQHEALRLKLTWADVHFEHGLGLHPTWGTSPLAHLSWCSLRTWVGTSSNLRHFASSSLELVFTSNTSWDFIQLSAALAASSLELMFTSNMSWDFIQLECSTCYVLTWAPEVQTSWGARLFHHWWVNELIIRVFVHFEHVGTSSNKCAVLTASSLKLLRTGLGCCSPSPSPNSVTSRKRVEFISLSGLHLTERVSLRNSELKPEPSTCCFLQRSIAICGPENFEVALHVTSTGHHLMERRACEC